MDTTVSVATTLGQSGPGSDCNKDEGPALPSDYHQIVLCYIQVTRWGSFTPLEECSRCILQPRPTGQAIICVQTND